MSEENTVEAPAILPRERVPIDSLRPHPENYRDHPDDQLAHIEHSLAEHGQYRNVVVARDGTILAGHGVVEAARRAGMSEVDVVRLDVAPDEPAAIRVLAGDNEVGRLAEVDERLLAEHLKRLAEIDGLLGTGFDAAMLASLSYVSLPLQEVEPPPHFPTLDPEALSTDYSCPSCGYEWSGSPRPGRE